ncbi:hypothetical protein E2C01_080931 [Portunus trituberculatus]|uniref:Uncharacterized protein n=1 Tax=Portunus trituberculatus TaxID=210409 RepID=A0A5B7IUH1_PORTR|nr:hypothetical protein [Portunus trituberculatus]
MVRRTNRSLHYTATGAGRCWNTVHARPKDVLVKEVNQEQKYPGRRFRILQAAMYWGRRISRWLSMCLLEHEKARTVIPSSCHGASPVQSQHGSQAPTLLRKKKDMLGDSPADGALGGSSVEMKSSTLFLEESISLLKAEFLGVCRDLQCSSYTEKEVK